MKKLAPYRKTLAAFAIGVLGWGAAVVASASGPITASEWIGLGTVAAVTLGVNRIANA